MDKKTIAVLRAEMQAQLAEILHIYERLNERRKKRGKAAAESIGFQLHNLYCAYEDLFEMVAERFENHVSDKSKYHIELLKRMTMSIEGVRPFLLSQESFVLLDNLRAFRHFFRHAYAYDLDERKVRIVLSDALKLKKIYHRDMSRYLDSF